VKITREQAERLASLIDEIQAADDCDENLYAALSSARHALIPWYDSPRVASHELA